MEQWHANNLKQNFVPRTGDSSFTTGPDVKQAERGDVMKKKKRLTSEQLESLEKSFQDEIKLDPNRKIKLATEIGVHPRQVAVWFQNRRARWKTKQLELLYDSLKLQFDAVSRDNHKLQDEVMRLRAMLMEQATRFNDNLNINQVSIGCNVEDYLLRAADDYNTVASPSSSYWPALPCYP